MAVFGTTPQWSPVMKTGNTQPGVRRGRDLVQASMEPGHEDREYGGFSRIRTATRPRLNGARS